jgi:hypothetical protein
LCIPLDLHDDDASYFIQDRILHLIIIAWWRLNCGTPVHHYGITSLKHVFTCPLSPNGQQVASIWSSRYSYLEISLLNLDDDHHLMSSTLMGYIRSYFWCMPMKRLLTHMDNTNEHSSQSLIDKAHHTMRSHEPM